MLLGALCGLFLAAEIEVAIAPDQPIPLVYADEPLVVELHPAENLGASIRIEARDTITNEVSMRDADNLTLIKDTPYWIALENFPYARGHYAIEVYLDGEEDVLLGEGTIAKVDRRPVRPTSMFILNVDEAAPGIELAAHAAGIGRVSVSPARAALFSNNGFSVEGRIKSSGPQLTTSDAEGWIALGADDPEGLGEAIATVRDADNGAAPWIGLTCTDDLDSAATAVKSMAPRWRVAHVDPMTDIYLESLRDRGERLGWERPTWSIEIAQRDPAAWLQALFTGFANGAQVVEISADSLWNGEHFEAPFVTCAALAHIIDVVKEPIGPVPLGEGITAHLFDTSNGWCIAAWSSEDAEAILPGESVRVRDALGAESDVEAGDDGMIHVPVGAMPKLIFGDGLTVRTMAAGAKAVAEAQALLATDNLDTMLSDNAVRAITIADSEDGPAVPRREFLLLLQDFARLEQRIATGELSEDVAVPVLAALTRFVRALCALEEDRGEIFLTPYLTRLERSSTFQAQYLTRGMVTRRGEVLNEEVRRLSALVRQVAARGYTTEAAGLGALAEWRARSLELTIP